MKHGMHKGMKKKTTKKKTTTSKKRMKKKTPMRGRYATKNTVPAPKGFHWMKSGKGFKLMKNPPGGYKPHPGATLRASFDIQTTHKRKK